MITNCQQCGKEIETYPSRVKKGHGKYCSRACYAKALSQRMQGENHPRYGVKHTEESLQKMRVAAQRNAQKGKNNPRFRGCWMSRGYKMINVNALEGRPRKIADAMTTRKHPGVAEHRLLVAVRENRPLCKKEVVHHLNGVKADNRLENLVLTNESDHKKTHKQVLADLRSARKEIDRLKSLLATYQVDC